MIYSARRSFEKCIDQHSRWWLSPSWIFKHTIAISLLFDQSSSNVEKFYDFELEHTCDVETTHSSEHSR